MHVGEQAMRCMQLPAHQALDPQPQGWGMHATGGGMCAQGAPPKPLGFSAHPKNPRVGVWVLLWLTSWPPPCPLLWCPPPLPWPPCWEFPPVWGWCGWCVWGGVPCVPWLGGGSVVPGGPGLPCPMCSPGGACGGLPLGLGCLGMMRGCVGEVWVCLGGRHGGLGVG